MAEEAAMVEITVPGVKLYWRRGKPYAYHRNTGVRLRSAIGSAEFVAEVELLNTIPRAADQRTGDGTLGALIEAYREGPEFAALAQRTRSDYQRIFDYLKPLRDDALADMKAADILEIRDAAFRAHKRRFANYVVAVLRLTLKWGAARDMIAVNPAAQVEKIRRPRSTPKANRPWDDDEREAVLAAATGGLRVVVGLGMFAALREGDAIRATRLIYDGAWLRWTQGKTSELVELPVDPRLKLILDAALADRAGSPVPAITLAFGARGRPYTLDGFRTMFFRLIRRLEEAGKVRPGLTFHGLRHTAGRTLAERGAEPRMIAAMLGHRTLAMAAHYSDEANRKKLAKAAVAKLRPRTKR
jgi:integrase